MINILARLFIPSIFFPRKTSSKSRALDLLFFRILLTVAGPIEIIFGRRTSTDLIVRPLIVFKSPFLMVSTSGNSGIWSKFVIFTNIISLP